MARSRKRQRNYATEYARRIAKGKAAGKSKREARGHAERIYPGRSEYSVRAERIRLKVGMSPSVASRLRRQVLNYIVAELEAVGTRHIIKESTIRHGLSFLHESSLQALSHIDGTGIKILARLDAQAVYNEEIFEDEEYEKDMPNPLWYG